MPGTKLSWKAMTGGGMIGRRADSLGVPLLPEASYVEQAERIAARSLCFLRRIFDGCGGAELIASFDWRAPPRTGSGAASRFKQHVQTWGKHRLVQRPALG